MSNPYAPPSPGKRPGRDGRAPEREGKGPGRHGSRPGQSGEPPGPDDPRPRPDAADPDAGASPGGPSGGPSRGPSVGPWPESPEGRPPSDPRLAGRPGVPAGPPSPPPDPEAVRAAHRRMFHLGLLMLATVLTYSLPLPWSAGAAVFSISAVVVGLLTVQALWRAGLRGPMVTLTVLFVLLAGFVTLALLTMLALYPVQAQREACLREALTISARERCEAEFEEAVTERLTPGTGATD